MGGKAGGFGDVLRCANASHHIFALRIDEEFAIKFARAGRGIAGKGHACGRGFTHIAKHHGLHIDRSAPAFGNIIEAPIGDGALIHPRPKHSANGAP